jgi:RIO-like serine/threonine protein kinase
MTYKLLNLKEFNKNDFKILKVLKSSPDPLPPTTLVFLTKLRSDKCSQRLKQLEKFSIIRVAYKRTIPFYELIKSDENEKS